MRSFVASINLSYVLIIGWGRRKAEIEGLPLYFDLFLENLIISLCTTGQDCRCHFPDEVKSFVPNHAMIQN